MPPPKITELENALIQAIKNDGPISGYAKTIETISTAAILTDELGNQRLVAAPPAFLFLLESSSLSSREPTAQHYDYALLFRIFAYNRNLRGPIEEKKGGPGSELGAYQMLDDLKRVLAGARLAASGPASQPLVELRGEQLEAMDENGTVLSLLVAVQTSWRP